MAYLLRRALFYLLAAAAAVVLNFLLPRLMPGDPATAMFANFKDHLSPSDIDAMREAYGLSGGSLWSQFTEYLGHLLQGDLGTSLSQFPAPVTSVVGDGLGWSVLLGTTVVVIGFVVGAGLGTLSAWRQGSRFDSVVPPLTMLIGAFPYFFLALVAVYVLSVKWPLLPLGQAYGLDVDPGWNIWFAGSVAQHLVLPAGTVVLVSVGGWLLTMRNTMIGVLDEDYLTMAHAKGLGRRRVMGAYAARNAILPTVTTLGMAIGAVFSGQLLTEVVFSYPGVGHQLYQAVTTHDYPLMQALFLIITLALLLVNLLVDAVYVLLDPRVRAGAATA
ncbi:MAG: ABC transporter permease [Kitasatospora sp.]|jgi:peptide/nickel transport system permease protein|nr:ABC transporter permease [Kitasatospora sp.]